MTTQDLVTDALSEIGVARAGDVIGPDDADFALRVFNRLLDEWNADRAAVYGDVFSTFVLVPAVQPHTIGPNAARFAVTQRPVSIEGANLVLTTTTPVSRAPLKIRDKTWWLATPLRDLSQSTPTDLYYSADWPNGSIYLAPVPTVAYSIELLLRVLLAQLALTDTFTLPPGYQSALTLTLAELLATPFGQSVTEETKRHARIARARVFTNNAQTPRLRTADAGMPRSRSASTFNYRTRQ
jgi:hypothetical protein